MPNRTDVIYIYDGTFDGFLCCVYSYYYSRFNPVDIVAENNFQPSFYQAVTIETVSEKAQKVKAAIYAKMSEESLDFLQLCMLTFLDKKENHMLHYIVKGFKMGKKIMELVSDKDVNALIKAERHLQRERHLYLGIVRFYCVDNVYISSIKPQNNILPLMVWHFTQRFANQNFMIYDEIHKLALIYSNGEKRLIQADNIQLPPPSEKEKENQKLWKLFYDTIAIKERYNPKCRMNFIPKRTWDRLTEMQDFPLEGIQHLNDNSKEIKVIG